MKNDWIGQQIQIPVDQMNERSTKRMKWLANMTTICDKCLVDNMANRSYYCIEGTEMRQLCFKVRRLLFLNRY
jgi:hypothetical protein